VGFTVARLLPDQEAEMIRTKPSTRPVGERTRRAFGRLRQRDSGRWQAAYTHRGVVYAAAATFPTKSSAVAWLEDERELIELDRRNRSTWTPPAQRAARSAAEKLTLRGYATTWLEHRNVSPRTKDNYAYHLDRQILPVLGDMVLAEIGPEDVRVWFAGLGTEHRTRNAQAYGVLGALLNTATDDGLIDRSPARIKGAAAVKHTKRSVVLLEPHELAALAEAMPAPLRMTVLLAGWCGLRRGELFALRRDDIAGDGATVRVHEAVTHRHGRSMAGPTKTKESRRTVTVPVHVRAALIEHLREHVSGARDALLFADPVTGSFYAEGRYRTPFFAAREAIDKGDLHFHDLRHFGGVMAALAGGTTREVMDRLGHTTSGTAMRYQHVAKGRADALADRLSALAGRT
jgi:integrase